MTHPRHIARRAGSITIGLLAIGSFALPVSVHAAAFTGTGGGPETTVNAPYRSSVGQTMPPGRAGAPETTADERTQRQQGLDRVLDSICVGC